MNAQTWWQIGGFVFQAFAIICFAVAAIVSHKDALREKDEQHKQHIVQMKAILYPTPIEKEFPVKIIAGKIEDGVINLPIGKDKYPIITDDASTIFTRIEINEEKRERYDTDLFFYLFVKWMNSNYHQGWLLLHDVPVIDKSQWHEPLADKNVDNSNVFTSDHLPSELQDNNIFFSDPTLFENGNFKFASHTRFPIEELAIVLPPETEVSFLVNSQEGTMITFDNTYCNVTFRLTACSSGPGLPHEMLDPKKRFSEREFYRHFTVNYQVSFRARFKDTDDFAEQKKCEKWVNTLINYFQPYFDWDEFKIDS